MKFYINPMTGQQCIAETTPPGLWSCLGEVEGQKADPVNHFQDVDMSVGADFDDDKDI